MGINGKAIENAYEGRSDFETMKTCLFDSRGRVFHSKSKEAEDSAFQENPGFQSSGGIHVMRLGGEKYIYAAQKLKKSDFIIVNMIPEKDVIMAAVGELPFTVLSILFLFLAILVSGIGVSKRSTSFVNDLGNALNEVKNKNYDVRMKEYPNRAENELSRTFNEMTEKMKRLINEHYRARIMKQEIELELIQQQMNPHFLFNILTVIQIKAKLGGSDEIYQMLKALSGFMRGSLYTDKNNRVMLEKEIEYTEFYLYLQKQRFEEKLIYEIDVPQNLKKCQLPRLTIEPLAENAVIHGMEGTNRTLSIKITAKQQENYIEICVEDNGCGFNTAEVDLSVKDIGPEDKREKIGLNNTNNRLILLYGEECRLHITSEIGKGTKIWFKIPGEDGDNLCIR